MQKCRRNQGAFDNRNNQNGNRFGNRSHRNCNKNRNENLENILDSILNDNRRCGCNNNFNDNIQEVEIIPRAFAQPRCPVICGYPLYTDPITGELDL
jgi:hypothetical protein